MASNRVRDAGGSQPELDVALAHTRVNSRCRIPHRNWVREMPAPRDRPRATAARWPGRYPPRPAGHRSRSRPRIDAMHPLGHLRLERAREVIEPCGIERQSGRHRMPAKTHDQPGITRGNGFEHIADVNPGNGSRRAAQLHAIARRRERHHRTTHSILDATGHQSDHSLVPATHRTGTAPRAGCPWPTAPGDALPPAPAPACRLRSRVAAC